MHKISITSASVQEQSFALYDMNLRLTLYYNKWLKGYQFDLFDLNNNVFITKMKGLTVGSPALIEFDLPFVLTLGDKSGYGLNAVSQTDFANRMALFIMTKEEYHETIRTSYTA
ncbi:hypothetical protein DES39_0122 [Orbus hercynius]|uniref:Cyanophage baseplate Pam3 plug gp18 domain-containing protein n=1 Tax=Orbus hercynius TaxID=593135 RepID=A0A495RIA2_9GAMM|nr:hypothetical protein [Orbus hercynius]RKS86916.1 hypothetical protein DES39_0122 [Orbus hercynius]